jgi:hypothetical protein
MSSVRDRYRSKDYHKVQGIGFSSPKTRVVTHPNCLKLSGLSCLVHQAVFMFLGPHVRSGRAHGQVGGSSGKSGPPVRDG